MTDTASIRMESAAAFRVTLHGSIDNSNATDLAQALVRIVNSSWGESIKSDGSETLILDLSQVEYINSMGIGALLRCKQAAEEHGRKMLIILHCGLADIFEVAKLHTVFELVRPYKAISAEMDEEAES